MRAEFSGARDGEITCSGSSCTSWKELGGTSGTIIVTGGPGGVSGYEWLFLAAVGSSAMSHLDCTRYSSNHQMVGSLNMVN